MTATILYGWTWVGDEAPSTGVMPGQQWYQPTTGLNWQRDTTNSIWNPMGSSDAPYAGNIQSSGGIMTGPLTGAPNLPSLTDPDFQGVVTQEGYPVALQNDLTNLQKYLTGLINTQVRQQFLSNFQQSGTAANIAFSFVTISQNVALWEATNPTVPDTGIASIPYPVFASDGVTATPAQVQFAGFSLAGCLSNAGDTSVVAVSKTSQMGILVQFENLTNTTLNFSINLFAIATR